MALIDISRPLGSDTVVWPGDRAVSLEHTAARSAGDAVNTGVLHMSLHAATHLDAPRHLEDAGLGVDEVALSRCWGRARVVDVGDAERISPALLPPLDGVTRVLFKTACSAGPDPAVSPGPFPTLEPAAAEMLVEAGVVLVGVDAPSVDRAEDEALPVHHVLLGSGVVVLENLWLGEVVAGDYELVALPLKLTGGDGSPVRAVLRRLDDLESGSAP